MIHLYLDEDSMDKDLVSALRARGLDVVTALEMGKIHISDEEHLIYASQVGRVLFSFNRGDFYKLHLRYLAEGKIHSGIILANQQRYSVGEAMRRILLISAAKNVADMKNQAEFLSAWAYRR